MSKYILRGVILFFLMAPFWGLLSSVSLGLEIEWGELLWTLRNTFWQALGSTLATLILGFIGALGLLWFRTARYSWFMSVVEGALIVPSFLPSIYVILASLQMLDPFPMGRTGVIFVHTMMNFGMIAVVLSQIIQKKLSSMSETAEVLGFGFWSFLNRVAWPTLKEDFARLGFFVFALCFTSFAVPLTVGGGRGTTIEVLIFEKIRFGLNWNQAFTLTLIQILILFLISLGTPYDVPKREQKSASVRILPWSVGFWIVMFFTLWLYGSFLLGFSEGLYRLSELFEIQDALIKASVNTYLLSVFGGLAIAGFYLLMVFIWPDRFLEKILHGYVAPSTVMIGFGLILLLQKWSFISDWAKLLFGLWILFFPTLLRWGGISDLTILEKQIEVSETLGASRFLIFTQVTLPQILSRATWIGGVGAFWISGEFALSRILMNQDKTLGLMANTLMSSYKLSLGTVLCALMLVMGLLAFMTLRGFQYVYRRKSLR